MSGALMNGVSALVKRPQRVSLLFPPGKATVKKLLSMSEKADLYQTLTLLLKTLDFQSPKQ